MSEFKLVPVTPTVEMIAALGFDGDSDLALGHGAISVGLSDAYAAMLAAAPQPPALGGDPEVVAEVVNKYGDPAPFAQRDLLHRTDIDKLKIGTELVDRAHVARLQSERDDIQRQFDELAERWAKLVTDENGKFARVCGERDKALAEVERLKVDAARYRFLRNGGNVKIDGEEVAMDVVCSSLSATCWDGSECIEGDELESAIDAALAEGAKS